MVPNRIIFHAEVLPLANWSFSCLHTVPMSLSDIQYPCMGSAARSPSGSSRPSGLSKLGQPFFQLGPRNKEKQIAASSGSTPVILHSLTPLLVNPPESICCSDAWCVFSMGCQSPFPPRACRSSCVDVWGMVLCCASSSWGRLLHVFPGVVFCKNHCLASQVLWGLLIDIFKAFWMTGNIQFVMIFQQPSWAYF